MQLSAPKAVGVSPPECRASALAAHQPQRPSPLQVPGAVWPRRQCTSLNWTMCGCTSCLWLMISRSTYLVTCGSSTIQGRAQWGAAQRSAAAGASATVDSSCRNASCCGATSVQRLLAG